MERRYALLGLGAQLAFVGYLTSVRRALGYDLRPVLDRECNRRLWEANMTAWRMVRLGIP